MIFNNSNAASIVCSKVTLLLFAISCCSTLLVVDIHSVVVKIILVYIAALGTAGYPLMYNKAYDVARNLQDFKVVLGTSKLRCPPEKLRVHSGAISTDGVWVGSLRTFERDSVPVYFNFVFNQIVSIVLAWG